MNIFIPSLHGLCGVFPTGKVRSVHCWDTIEGRNVMIPQDFYGTDSDLSRRQVFPQLCKMGSSQYYILFLLFFLSFSVFFFQFGSILYFFVKLFSGQSPVLLLYSIMGLP